MRGFSGFGFPKSHAAAFGLLAYQSTWLRVHYGPELLCALFNEQPMGFYPPDSLTHEAQRRGIEVRAADVNAARWSARSSVVESRTAPSPPSASASATSRASAEEEAEALVAERERGGAYRDLADLASRSGIGRDGLERLAWAGACESLGRRRAARRRAATSSGGSGSPAAVSACAAAPHAQLALPLPLPAPPDLRPLDSWERIVADYSSTGVTLGEHPIEVLRPELDAGLARSEDLAGLADGAAIAARRPGRRPPAPGDREGGRVHAARGRGRGRST